MSERAPRPIRDTSQGNVTERISENLREPQGSEYELTQILRQLPSRDPGGRPESAA